MGYLYGIIGGILTILVIVMIVMTVLKSKKKVEFGEEKVIRELHVNPVEKKLEKSENRHVEKQKEAKVQEIVPSSECISSGDDQENQKKATDFLTEGKKELFQYMNQAAKMMHLSYKNQTWEQLKSFGKIGRQGDENIAAILQTLPDASKELVSSFFDCLDFQEEEGERVGYVRDSGALKKIFLQMVLPFYAVYCHEFNNGLRYTCLLNRSILEVFHQLSGRKFSVGYKNRYNTGVKAFTWEKEQYCVFRADGKQLCDAKFRDGKVENGYAIVRVPKESLGDWEVYQDGMFAGGRFIDGILRYEYKKECK